MDLSHQDSRLLRQLTQDFRQAMEIRNQMNLRVARRVTMLLRLGAFSLIFLVMVLLALLWAMNSRTAFILEAMEGLGYQFTVMADDMRELRQTVEKIDHHVAAMARIAPQVVSVGRSVAALKRDIAGVDTDMDGIRRHMEQVTQHVGQMTTTFRRLDSDVHVMGAGVSRMSRPMKMFNSLTPGP